MARPPFDVTRVPLTGTHLVEASAGTGKTFQLSTLYVRLVAEALIPVDRILVVTFTRAATQELSERVRARLSQLISDGPAPDEALEAIASRAGKAGRAAAAQALCRFDEACIFTIHGFCQRVLSENAFESLVSFDSALCPNAGDLLREICEDFHRTRVAPLPEDFLRAAKDLGPEALMRVASFCERHPDIALQAPEAMPDLSVLARARELHSRLSREWPGSRAEAARLLLSPALSAVGYRKIEPKDGGPSREEKISELLEVMDEYSAYGPAHSFPKELSLLCAGTMAKKTLKGKETPSLPVFDLCQELSDAAQECAESLDTARRRLLAEAFLYAREELPRRKERHNLMAYGDLIAALARGLSGENAEALAEAVSGKFDVALIDEFQDTDPLQYEIFSRLFAQEEKGLFLIGDPKQAIYGFRGADLFSYLEAVSRAGSLYTLARNWRSTPEQISAVNRIFEMPVRPFLLPGVDFDPVEPADKPESGLFIDGEKIDGLLFWNIMPLKGEYAGKVSKKRAERQALAAVTAEISRLIALGARGRARVGEENFAPGHAAVLVRTNRQAIAVKTSLAAAGIPAVLHTSQNLFGTPEARDLLFLMTAAGEPGNRRALRSALAVPLLDKGMDELCALVSGQEQSEAAALAFRSFHKTWASRGFFAMFTEMAEHFSLAPRLLSSPGGERSLANIFQLVEFLATAEHGQALSPAGLRELLARRICDPDEDAGEENVLRIESDEDAVQVMTVHRSKGLEYPVVFAPFAFDPATPSKDRADIVFHDPERGKRMTLCLLADPGPGGELYESEVLAENVRLFYVAATRARHASRLVWGNIYKCEASALAYLLHQPPASDPEASPALLMEKAQKRFKKISDEDFLRDLSRLHREGEESLRIRELPEDPAIVAPPAPGPRPEPRCRLFAADMDRSFGLTSFSGLSAGAEGAEPGEDEPDLFFAPRIPRSPKAAADEIFSFPRGPEAGLAIHEVLERCDYAAGEGESLLALCEEVLLSRGMDPGLGRALARMAQNVLLTPLLEGRPHASLSRVPAGDRVHEMEFALPVGSLSPEAMALPFRDTGAKPPWGPGRLDFAPVKGFLRGFVDLTFVMEGRTYIADFKSNHLGDRLSDYGAEGMGRAMDEHLYALQYLLYCLAVTQALSLRNPGFDYERDFGGVFYLFTRGMRPEQGPETGVFFGRPDPALLKSMEKHWIAGPGFGPTLL